MEHLHHIKTNLVRLRSHLKHNNMDIKAGLKVELRYKNGTTAKVEVLSVKYSNRIINMVEYIKADLCVLSMRGLDFKRIAHIY